SPPPRAAIPRRPTDRPIALRPPSPYSLATPGRNRCPVLDQKQPPRTRTFDFSIPEARLLLTQFPRDARPRNSPPFSRRFSPPRILSKMALDERSHCAND